MVADMLLAREDEQERLRAVLKQAAGNDGGVDEGYLVLVHGLGGAGKTQLLRRYLTISTGENRGDELFAESLFAFLVDFESQRERHRDDYAPTGPPLWRVLEGIYAGLGRAVASNASAKRALERAFRQFRELAAHAPNDMEPVEPIDDGGKSLDATVGDLAGLLSVLAPQGAVTATGATHLVSGMRNAVRAQRSLRKGQVGSRELEAALSPDEALAQAFADGLRSLSRQTRPIVVLLDTAELLGDARIPLFEVIRSSGSRCVWVVAMRLDQGHLGDDPVGDLYLHTLPSSRLRIVEPARFTTEDIAAYLAAALPQGVPADLDLQAVARLTRGVPLAVRLFANLIEQGVPASEAVQEIATSGEVSSVVVRLARRYLVHVAPPGGAVADLDFPLILGLALMRGDDSDPDLLGALWDVEPDAVAPIKERLARYHDFVLPHTGSLHADVKYAVQLFLLQPEYRAMVRKANSRAVDALRERLMRISPASVHAQLDSEDWRTTATTLQWHLFWRDEREGLKMLCSTLPAAQLLRPTFARVLLHTADFFVQFSSEDVRLSVAGLHALFPTSPLVERVNILFRSAWEESTQDSSTPVRYATTALSDGANCPERVLADDIAPDALLALLKLQQPEGFGVESPSERWRLVAKADELLPAPRQHTTPIDSIVARAAETVGRDALADGSDGALSTNIARDAAELAARRDPNQASVWSLLETAADSEGDHLQALRASSELIRLRPGLPGPHHNQGVTLARLDRWDEAIAAFERAVELDPHNAKRRHTLARALGSGGNFSGALAVIDGSPSDEPTHGLRGVNLSRLGHYDEAVEEFDRAIHFAPTEAIYKNNRAEALLLSGRVSEAIEGFREVLELRPDSFEARVLLALAVHDTDSDESGGLLEMALASETGEVTPFRAGELRAIALLLLGDIARARAELRSAVPNRKPVDVLQEPLYARLRIAAGPHLLDELLSEWPDAMRQLAAGDGA